jgi:phosphoglycerate dehydrogenase-like enzyme
VHGVDGLPTLLPHHDVVILLTPLVEATRGLVDATFLAALPDGALVVNIARGPVVDTAALLAAGVLVTPHVGGAGDSFRPRMVALLRDQLGRYAADRPLLGVVAGPGMAR